MFLRKNMKEIKDLSKEEAERELEYIAKEMAKSDIAYYQKDNPYLTDAQYDSLKRRNEEIEARFPELVRSDSPIKKRDNLLPAFSQRFYTY